MIKDTIENISLYRGLSDNVANAVEFLAGKTVKELMEAKYPYYSKGFKVDLLKYDTKPQDEGEWEAHKKYIDIQYIIKGCEMTGYLNLSKAVKTHEYDVDNDIYFCEVSEKGDYFVVNQGEFVLFTPKDLHMPSLYVDEKQYNIQKIIVKIEN